MIACHSAKNKEWRIYGSNSCIYTNYGRHICYRLRVTCQRSRNRILWNESLIYLLFITLLVKKKIGKWQNFRLVTNIFYRHILVVTCKFNRLHWPSNNFSRHIFTDQYTDIRKNTIRILYLSFDQLNYIFQRGEIKYK